LCKSRSDGIPQADRANREQTALLCSLIALPAISVEFSLVGQRLSPSLDVRPIDNVPAEETSLNVSAQFPRGKWLETRPVAIVITSRNDDQLCEQAMAADASGFLLKPFDNHRLKSAVSTALKISQL